MKELEKKYKQNNLSPEELKELRAIIQHTPDSDIEESMYDSWLHDSFDENEISKEQLEKIRQKIKEDIFPKEEQKSIRLFSIKRIAQIAAAIAIPLLLLITVQLYRENQNLSGQEIIVATTKGEKANLTLPDGTLVVLNSESQLKYTPQHYNKKERKVQFEGEAYFDVTKNEKSSFIIDTKGLEVRVLGTKFNLLAREKMNIVELSLEEGHVLLSSFKEQKEIFENHRAVLDRSTGKISVTKENHIKNASAWKSGKLVFQNARLQDVLNDIERNYNVSISMEKGTNMNKNDLFTGSIVSNNLLEALDIIRYSYHLNYVISNNHIKFSKE